MCIFTNWVDIIYHLHISCNCLVVNWLHLTSRTGVIFPCSMDTWCCNSLVDSFISMYYTYTCTRACRYPHLWKRYCSGECLSLTCNLCLLTCSKRYYLSIIVLMPVYLHLTSLQLYGHFFLLYNQDVSDQNYSRFR